MVHADVFGIERFRTECFLDCLCILGSSWFQHGRLHTPRLKVLDVLLILRGSQLVEAWTQGLVLCMIRRCFYIVARLGVFSITVLGLVGLLQNLSTLDGFSTVATSLSGPSSEASSFPIPLTPALSERKYDIKALRFHVACSVVVVGRWLSDRFR